MIARAPAERDFLSTHRSSVNYRSLLYTLAHIQHQLIRRLEANQARTWVLDVKHDVDDDYREERKA